MNLPLVTICIPMYNEVGAGASVFKASLGYDRLFGVQV